MHPATTESKSVPLTGSFVQLLLRGSKALAALRGKSYITPDEVLTLAAPVLRHRLLLTPEHEVEGGTVDEVIAGVVSVPTSR